MKNIILTGVKPTGTPHLGNYCRLDRAEIVSQMRRSCRFYAGKNNVFHKKPPNNKAVFVLT